MIVLFTILVNVPKLFGELVDEGAVVGGLGLGCDDEPGEERVQC
jgi:hypothetical protein